MEIIYPETLADSTQPTVVTMVDRFIRCVVKQTAFQARVAGKLVPAVDTLISYFLHLAALHTLHLFHLLSLEFSPTRASLIVTEAANVEFAAAGRLQFATPAIVLATKNIVLLVMKTLQR